MMDKILAYFAVKYDGDWHKIYNAVFCKEKTDENEVKEVLNNLKSKWITILSNEYPESLKSMQNPPFVLFYQGNLELLNYKKTLAVIGSRDMSVYGKNCCQKIVKDLVLNDYLIVSGVACGIDSEAHAIALKYNKLTIGILGHGIYFKNGNHSMIKDIINKGLIISEYPDNSYPRKEKFKIRNRLISGLSKGVLVIEAKYKSGTMNTVKHALNQGKEIFAIPSDINRESGCNKLIKEGAKLVECYQDIQDEL